jgi:hypothetical protein
LHLVCDLRLQVRIRRMLTVAKTLMFTETSQLGRRAGSLFPFFFLKKDRKQNFNNKSLNKKGKKMIFFLLINVILFHKNATQGACCLPRHDKNNYDNDNNKYILCICMYTHTHTHTHIHIYISLSLCVYIYVYKSIYTQEVCCLPRCPFRARRTKLRKPLILPNGA